MKACRGAANDDGWCLLCTDFFIESFFDKLRRVCRVANFCKKKILRFLML